MTTKSFTRAHRFNHKQADSLIYALINNSNPQFAKLPRGRQVHDLDELKEMFFRENDSACPSN